MKYRIKEIKLASFVWYSVEMRASLKWIQIATNFESQAKAEEFIVGKNPSVSEAKVVKTYGKEASDRKGLLTAMCIVVFFSEALLFYFNSGSAFWFWSTALLSATSVAILILNEIDHFE